MKPDPSGAARSALALDGLRNATRAGHDAIERLLALDQALTLSRYVAILRGFACFLPAWWAQICNASPAEHQQWLAGRDRFPFVERDLERLGATIEVATPVPVAACLSERSLPAVYGSLYVLEGSALGGQVIAPRLARDHGLQPDSGAAYFHGFGTRTGPMWREFRERAELAIGDDPRDRIAACESACLTFEALHSVMARFLAERAVDPLAFADPALSA